MGRLCYGAEDGVIVELQLVFRVLQVGSPDSVGGSPSSGMELPLRFPLSRIS